MVQILGWEIKRIAVEHTPDKCEICRDNRWHMVPTLPREYRGVFVCDKCETDAEVKRRLDLEYWRSHPNSVPRCMNCEESVPPEQLSYAVCFDWYFCLKCATDTEVLRRYEQIRERAAN
jgi:hypothetical protein